MIPGTQALDLYYGDTWTGDFRLWADAAMTTPANLTGVTARAQIRDAQMGALLLELTVAVEQPQTVHVTLPATLWTIYFDTGAWDLQLTYPGGVVQTIVAGPVRVIGDVTRAP